MPLHDFQCRSCGRTETHSFIPEPYPCPCGGLMKRKFSFNTQKSWQPHFNTAVGKYVSTKQEFNDALKSASAYASSYTGMEHDFKSTDLRDESSHSLEGLYESNKLARDSGWVEPDKKLFT